MNTTEDIKGTSVFTHGAPPTHTQNCRNHTAADRQSISKSQPKSSSKRIRSSIYTLTAGISLNRELSRLLTKDTVSTELASVSAHYRPSASKTQSLNETEEIKIKTF